MNSRSIRHPHARLARRGCRRAELDDNGPVCGPGPGHPPGNDHSKMGSWTIAEPFAGTACERPVTLTAGGEPAKAEPFSVRFDTGQIAGTAETDTATDVIVIGTPYWFVAVMASVAEVSPGARLLTVPERPKPPVADVRTAPGTSGRPLRWRESSPAASVSQLSTPSPRRSPLKAPAAPSPSGTRKPPNSTFTSVASAEWPHHFRRTSPTSPTTFRL